MFKILAIVSILALTANALEKSSGLRQLIGTKYSVSGYQTTFLDAFVTCKGLGLELASILNDTEEAELKKTVPIGTVYWLGAVYEQTKVFSSQWIWINSWQTIDYANWSSDGEPNPGNTAFCVARDATGYWVTLPCDAQHFFLCQLRN